MNERAWLQAQAAYRAAENARADVETARRLIARLESIAAARQLEYNRCVKQLSLELLPEY